MTQVLTKVSEVRGELPQEAEDPIVFKSTGNDLSSMYLSFSSDEMTPSQITDYVQRVVQPKIATLEGAGEVEVSGGKVFAMRLWLDPLKMAALNVSADEVNAAILNNNFLSTAGNLESEFHVTRVKAITSLNTVEDFSQLIVREDGERIIRIRDIATVELAPETFRTQVFFNGTPAVFLGVSATPTANPLDVIKRVKAAMPALAKQLPNVLKMEVATDATEAIEASIDEVVVTFVEALIIVIIVVLLFLGDLRSVIIPIIAIPLSLIGTLFLMLTLGYSINLLTLLAMVLAIGLVVDDAIVVMENIHRHIEEGLPPIQAALKGTREIALPVIAMTITLAAVYAPIGFVTGVTGALFKEFAFTLAASVVVSGVVALTLSPMMCSRLLSSKQSTSRFSASVDAFFDSLQQRYQNRLADMIAHRPVILLLAVAILFSIPYMMSQSRQELAPAEDSGRLILFSQAPKSTNVDYMTRNTQAYKAMVDSTPEMESYFLINGFAPGEGFSGITMTPWEERERDLFEIGHEVQQKVNKIPGIKVFAFPSVSLPGSGGGAPVKIVLRSTADFAPLAEVTATTLQKLQKSGLFSFANSQLAFDTPELRITIDRSKAALMGIRMSDIGSALSVLLGEGNINRFAIDGRSYRVIPQAADYARYDDSWLANYHVRTSSGDQVSLATVIDTEVIGRPTSLEQFQQLNSATIEGAAASGVSVGEIVDYVNTEIIPFLPAGFNIDYDGQSRQYVQEGNQLFVTFVLALLTIFLVLAAQFESYRDPFVVLMTVPLSICGALVPIFLGITTFNIYSQVGLITLIGLITKHGILIVEFANQLQREGRSKVEAVIEAAKLRLRAILMTTAATVMGVVPLLIASGAGAASRFNIGLMIAVGMAVGTLFTLFVIPVMYSYLASDRKVEPKAKPVFTP